MPRAVLHRASPCGIGSSWVLSACMHMQAVNVLSRARRLGIKPNTVMYNVALSALGKSGDWQVCSFRPL